jgi:alpha-tubulin suppressor-like RCC1 family protein
MAERYPGGVISKTPPEVIGSSGGNLYGFGRNASGELGLAGNIGQASGVWSLSEVLAFTKANSWPQVVVSSGNRSSPVSIGASQNWSNISAGSAGSHAIKSDGTLWGWGFNYGQIGNNNTANLSSPVQIGTLADWSSVSSCGGATLSVKTNNTLWSWGANANGQLGDNTIVSKSSPVQIGALTNWSQVSAGRFSAASVKTDGTLWAWGNGQNGELGINLNAIYRSSPVQVGALTNWAKVASGRNHVTSVKTDGTLWSWGTNQYGQLGQNITAGRSSPVQIGALTNWAQVAGGSYFTSAVKTDGTLWAWGFNNSGRLGDNSATNRSSPVQIGALTNWAQVDLSENSASSYGSSAAIKTDKTLWAWGSNGNGQLGDNTIVARSSPVQVGASSNWLKISVGTAHVLAITTG